MKYPLKWIVPAAGLLILTLWLVAPKLSDADKNTSLEAQFDDLGIISQVGLVPSADLVLSDLNDQRSKIADYQGKIVLLNLWATWCPECVREMPALEKLQNKLGHNDFAVVAIDLKETKEVVAKFAQEHKLTFEILLDQEGKMGEAFNVRSIPTTYILGRNGQLLGRVMGARDWDDSDFVALFRKLINARQPLTAGAKSKPITEAKQTTEASGKSLPAQQ